MDLPEVPDSCLDDDHDYDQTGRCNDCGVYRNDTADGWENRRSGGAGASTSPLTNGEYRDAMRRLSR